LRILGIKKLSEFAEEHANARKPLARCRKAVEGASWDKTMDVKRDFWSADFVGAKTVFDIGGNNCRLIASIDFKSKDVTISHVLTHGEYDKGGWKRWQRR
jgi:mRNA interferase HigB